MQEHGEDEKEAMQAACESIEGLVVGQAEVVTPVLTKERKPIQEADSSPEVRETTQQCLTYMI